jgi:amidohydrolase
MLNANPTADRDGRLAAEVARLTEPAIAVRRQLHAHPELGLEEHATAAFVADRCEALGLAVRRGVGVTGVLAELDSGRPGRTLLVRADMDALPIEEADDGRPYRSQVPGVMHACGHDGHVAIVLAVAEILHTLRATWRGRVRFCFQPAEEIDVGARGMIADGALDGVDAALGIHLVAGVQTGRLIVVPGVMEGSCDTFEITVTGVGGHAGAPAGAVDPLPVAAELILALRELSLRPRAEPAVVTVAQIQAGTAANVIPDEVLLRGTIRTLDADERGPLREEAAAIAAEIGERAAAAVRFTLGDGCPALRNDVAETARVEAALVDGFGAEALMTIEPTTGADDMACYLERVPGCYFGIGASDLAAGPAHPHHHPAFDIDERSLAVGVEATARAALALLA